MINETFLLNQLVDVAVPGRVCVCVHCGGKTFLTYTHHRRVTVNDNYTGILYENIIRVIIPQTIQSPVEKKKKKKR